MNNINSNSTSDNRIRILVLGEYATGKSTIVDILINKDKERIPWADALNTYRAANKLPLTYYSDEYIITDTRGVENIIGTKRDEDHRAYMEKNETGGYHIVLCLFSARDFLPKDKNVMALYKRIFPELAGIMQLIITRWDEKKYDADQKLKVWYGREDMPKLVLPPYTHGQPEDIQEAYHENRMQSLAELEDCKQILELDPAIGVKVKDMLNVRPAGRFWRILARYPLLRCIGAFSLFIFVARKLA